MRQLELIDGTAEAVRQQLEELAGAAALERHLARPRLWPGAALLARQAGEPVGYALLAHTRHRLGAATLEAIEISALAANHPQARTALLGAALQAAAEQGAPLLTLWGRQTLYGPDGLAPAGLRSRLALPQPEVVATTLRPASAADLDDLAALHTATYAALALSPARAPTDWRWLLGQKDGGRRMEDGERRPEAGAGHPGTARAAVQGPELGGTHGLLALEDGRGRVISYARAMPAAGGLLVGEAAAADAGVARTLLGALSTHAANQALQLSLALAPEHPVARAALQLGATASLRAPAADEQTRLWGVVDLAGALGALLPELSARLARSRYAGWSGRLALEAAGGAAALTFVAGQAQTVAADGPSDLAVRQISLGGLAQLLLGYRDAGDLRATGDLRCADVDLALLDLLFPALAGVEVD